MAAAGIAFGICSHGQVSVAITDTDDDPNDPDTQALLTFHVEPVEAILIADELRRTAMQASGRAPGPHLGGGGYL